MSAAKQKGTAWETALVKYLGEIFGGRFGLVPRRVAQEGFKDTGDLHGLGPFIAQAKNWASWQDAIREGLDGAEKQKTNAGADYGVALVKRARRGTGEGYAVLTVETFARVLLRLQRAEALLSASSPQGYEEHIRAARLDC
ncbi:holliday junction resolvase [Arthrobacter phage BaileyBlu]|uniref:Holliday junction resolvase n=1 Tax=Arthrobacter phage BaileyBlu TaxID=2910754 RepID=A0AA49BNG7_9CAUD|nr:holliday junction resolvase [Arthrobacter phage BaileyBlu]UJQ87175.1 holliday junction resolvase [Arthrobacter phage BaileyBlu]